MSPVCAATKLSGHEIIAANNYAFWLLPKELSKASIVCSTLHPILSFGILLPAWRLTLEDFVEHPIVTSDCSKSRWQRSIERLVGPSTPGIAVRNKIILKL